MHITEGVAPVSVAAGAAALAAGGVAIGLHKMKDEQIPRAALMASAIFVASLVVRLPFGPTSVHPVLNGLAGLILGWAAVPAFLIVLFLQALLFQFGGITTLGINTLNMGLPAVACYYLYSRQIRATRRPRRAFWLGAAAAATALGLAFVMWAAALLLSGKAFAVITRLAVVPHLGLMAVESVTTGFLVAFLVRVYPAIFDAPQSTTHDPHA